MAVLTDLFTQIANAIREKTGDAATIQASQFATAIANIPSGSEVVVIKSIRLNKDTRTITDPQLVGKNNCVIMPTGRNDNLAGRGVVRLVERNFPLHFYLCG